MKRTARSWPIMPWQALRRVLNWHALRDESFRSPAVSGMRSRHAARRDRILSDDELRALWRATAEGKAIRPFRSIPAANGGTALGGRRHDAQ